MFKKFFSRFPLSPSGLVCTLVFAIGVFLRWRYIGVIHDPRNFIDPEMKTYIELAKVWFSPGYKLGPSDVFHHPGAATLFSSLVHIDPKMLLAARFMFAITALVPLVFMALGWAVFGKATAKVTLIVTSLYPPFIIYGGFFFSEVPMMLAFGLTLALYLWAARMKSPRAMLGLALASGFFLSLAMSFRFVALPAMMIFAAVFTLFFRGPLDPAVNASEAPDAAPAPPRWFHLSGPMRRIKLLTLAGVIAGAIPLTAAMTVRCTSGNENRLCLVSNRNASEFLLGHYGRIDVLTWKDGASTVERSSAASPKHNYTARPTVTFAVTDTQKNMAEAWQWIRKHPAEALLLSCEHIYDTFGGAFAWPQVASGSWMASEGSQFFFLLFLMLPALWLNFNVGTEKGIRALLGSPELLLLSPILGLVVAVFITTGEERCRIPFDGLFIIGAVVFFQRLIIKSSSATISASPAAPSPAEPVALPPAAAAVAAKAAGAFRRRFEQVRPWLTDILCAVLFAVGVYIRWHYITVDHDPRSFVWSDPKTYVDMGERWANPTHKPSGADAIFPPGAGILFAVLFKMDATKLLAVHFMFVITALVPLVFLALGWAAFGKPVGKAAMVVTSFYVPLVDYGGFFLTEIPMTLLFMSSLFLFLWAERMKSRWVALGMALMAGFLCSLAVTFKFVALPAVIFFALVYTLFYRRPSATDAPSADLGAGAPSRRWFNLSGPLRTIKLITLAGVIAGSLPVTAYMSVRCTRLNDNKFCLICTKTPADFLLGHYGRVGSLYWKGPRSTYGFGNSSSSQHGYTTKKEVPFELTDGEKNNAEAWKWIKKHPGEALLLSFEHVFDTFGGSMAWPPNVTKSWIPSQLSQYGFFVFMMMPALWLCVDAGRRRGLRGLLSSTEFLVLSPVFGVIGAVMVATGEARYRIPFDGIFIIVGVEFYNRYLFNRPKRVIAPVLEGSREAAVPRSDAAKPEVGPAPEEPIAVSAAHAPLEEESSQL